MTVAVEAPQATRLPFRTRFAVFLGTIALRIFGMTWRIRPIDDEGWRALVRERRPWVFAFWHGDMLPLAWAHRGLGVAVMVSEHRDGEIIARVLASVGMRTVRGSSTRGGSRALLAAIRELEAGTTVVFTPDGPRGPRHVFQPGTLAAAKRAGAPIIAIGVGVDRAWRLKSWDQFVIPKPFARVTLVYSAPTMVDPAAQDVAAEVPRFSALLDGVSARANIARPNA